MGDVDRHHVARTWNRGGVTGGDGEVDQSVTRLAAVQSIRLRVLTTAAVEHEQLHGPTQQFLVVLER